MREKCPRCKGRKVMFGKPCTLCHGAGDIEALPPDPCADVRREERAATKAALDDIQVYIDRVRARFRI